MDSLELDHFTLLSRRKILDASRATEEVRVFLPFGPRRLECIRLELSQDAATVLITFVLGYVLSSLDRWRESLRKLRNLKSVLYAELVSNYEDVIQIVPGEDGLKTSPYALARSSRRLSLDVYEAYLARMDSLDGATMLAVFDAYNEIRLLQRKSEELLNAPEPTDENRWRIVAALGSNVQSAAERSCDATRRAIERFPTGRARVAASESRRGFIPQQEKVLRERMNVNDSSKRKPLMPTASEKGNAIKLGYLIGTLEVLLRTDEYLQRPAPQSLLLNIRALADQLGISFMPESMQLSVAELRDDVRATWEVGYGVGRFYGLGFAFIANGLVQGETVTEILEDAERRLPDAGLSPDLLGPVRRHWESLSESIRSSGALDAKAIIDAQSEADRIIDTLGSQITS
ncbi:hypothetical protein [Arthrobacter oryzae]|uniref:hypothetical protein n=1 Tax=Arthrobacter oryzae TaxID=409290 RepID=UPI0027804AAF|nr:hypothetical protein [Arthrobacter oryzae]MDQ0078251.1 hypothetical protein [Arthrobacter oryzae]